MVSDDKRSLGLCRGVLPFRVPLPNPLGLLAWRPRLGFGRSMRAKRALRQVASASVATLAPLSEAVVVHGGTTTQVTQIGLSQAHTHASSGTTAQQATAAPQQAAAQQQGAGGSSRVPLKPASDVLAGALARAGSQSVIHPIDTLKVRLQTSMARAPPSAPAPAAGLSKIGQLVPPPLGAAAAAGVPKGFDAKLALAGLGSLYRGLVGAASGAGIAIGAYFAFYGAACNTLSRHTDLAPHAVAFVSGGAAALGSSFVKVPLAVCIRSVQAGVYPNVINAATSIAKAAGPRGLFTGFAPTVLEDVPDMAIKFAVYEALRSMYTNWRASLLPAPLPGAEPLKPSPQVDFTMGALAGALAAAATTPLDVIKTNMMCAAASRPSMSQAAAMVLAQGGPKAFFRGIGTRALSNGINSAVFFCFFETIRGAMAQAKEQRVRLSSAAAERRRSSLATVGHWEEQHYALASAPGARGSQLVLANAAASAASQHWMRSSGSTGANVGMGTGFGGFGASSHGAGAAMQ